MILLMVLVLIKLRVLLAPICGLSVCAGTGGFLLSVSEYLKSLSGKRNKCEYCGD